MDEASGQLNLRSPSPAATTAAFNASSDWPFKSSATAVPSKRKTRLLSQINNATFTLCALNRAGYSITPELLEKHLQILLVHSVTQT